MKKSDPTIPLDKSHLFWDVDVSSLSLTIHSEYIIERVVTKGNWCDISWLSTVYNRYIIVDKITNSQGIPPHIKSFWLTMMDREL